jgi:hypothetical protein
MSQDTTIDLPIRTPGKRQRHLHDGESPTELDQERHRLKEMLRASEEARKEDDTKHKEINRALE